MEDRHRIEAVSEKDWSRGFKVKISARIKTMPESTNLGSVCPSLSLTSLVLFQPARIQWFEVVAGLQHQQRSLQVEHHGAAEPAVSRLQHWWARRMHSTASLLTSAWTRASPCRGIYFTCFLICWSNRVRPAGKAKIAFKLPNSLRRLLSVYNVVTVSKLMDLFCSHSSESKVAQQKSLPEESLTSKKT